MSKLREYKCVHQTEEGGVYKMRKKLNSLRIELRLKKSFRRVIYIFSACLLMVLLIMLYMVNDYSKILDNYAYPQGDIALVMNESAEVRAATRGLIGYDSEELIESMQTQHDEAVKKFEELLEQVRPTMVTEAGHTAMEEIDKAWKDYKESDAKVGEVGATTDVEQSLEAQQMMLDETAPKYQKLDEALENLMSVNVSCGNTERANLKVLLIIAIALMVIVSGIAVSYSTKLATMIAKSIAVPLHALKERFATFAEGDLDSPLPETETEDEIAELVVSIGEMAKRIHIIIDDAGRLLNQMAEGNFAVNTACEEQYMGAFHALIMGMRKMNRQIDNTIHGVSEAAEQVLAGSTNLAESATSVAEGATDQAAAVEEMQATIDELSNGIKATADELEKSYVEAHKYASVAEASREDMEAMVEAMNRISETSAKIGEIIAQIEDIASQTNLLSLNASIEAARAGESGKGFAVVADQIRMLAEQSAKSAVDSKELIESAIAEIEEGNQSAVKASDSLKEVVDGVKMVADSAKKMKEISLEQAESMEQADEAVARIAEVVQDNSAAAEETSATSEELTAQATSLSDTVSVFKLR